MIYNNQIPRDLIEAFLSQKVVVFIGSGFSVQSNLPTWNELVNLVGARLRGDSSFWEREEPIRVFQKYVDESNSRMPLVNLIKEEFESRNAVYNNCHNAIVHLPVRFICTTNWDDLLESAMEKELGVKPRVIWKDSQISALGDRDSYIIKLHGTLTDPDTLIVTEDDYMRLISHRPLLVRFIELLLANSVVLFLGYSFSDYDLKLVFSSMLGYLQKAKPPAYIFMANEPLWTVEYLNARGINPIHYENSRLNKTDLSVKFLQQLTKEAAIYAEDRLERVSILIRENHRQLERIGSIGIIRNSANLGAFAIPEPTPTMRFFSDEKDSSPLAERIDKLEWEGHNIWLIFVQNGIQIRQVVSLNRHGLLQRYSPKQAKARLEKFISVVSAFDSEQVQIVFQNAPIYINETFFGDHTLIQLRKFSILERVYTQVRIIRDEGTILGSKASFDSYFDSLKRLNLSQAVGEGICEQNQAEAEPYVCLRSFLLATVRRISEEIELNET